jgi:hypothetical protein
VLRVILINNAEFPVFEILQKVRLWKFRADRQIGFHCWRMQSEGGSA